MTVQWHGPLPPPSVEWRIKNNLTAFFSYDEDLLSMQFPVVLALKVCLQLNSRYYSGKCQKKGAVSWIGVISDEQPTERGLADMSWSV